MFMRRLPETSVEVKGMRKPFRDGSKTKKNVKKFFSDTMRMMVHILRTPGPKD